MGAAPASVVVPASELGVVPASLLGVDPASATGVLPASVAAGVEVPASLAPYALERSADGGELSYTYDTRSEQLDMVGFMRHLGEAGITFKDLQTTQSSLEDIFVDLVKQEAA